MFRVSAEEYRAREITAIAPAVLRQVFGTALRHQGAGERPAVPLPGEHTIKGITTAEFDLIQDVIASRLSLSSTRPLTDSGWGSSLIAAIHHLRIARACFGNTPPRVLLIGSGTGVTGAALLQADLPLCAIEWRAESYIESNHWWNELVRLKNLCAWARPGQNPGVNPADVWTLENSAAVDLSDGADARRHLMRLCAPPEPTTPRVVTVPWWRLDDLAASSAQFDIIILSEEAAALTPNQLEVILDACFGVRSGDALQPCFILWHGSEMFPRDAREVVTARFDSVGAQKLMELPSATVFALRAQTDERPWGDIKRELELVRSGITDRLSLEEVESDVELWQIEVLLDAIALRSQMDVAEDQTNYLETLDKIQSLSLDRP